MTHFNNPQLTRDDGPVDGGLLGEMSSNTKARALVSQTNRALQGVRERFWRDTSVGRFAVLSWLRKFGETVAKLEGWGWSAERIHAELAPSREVLATSPFMRRCQLWPRDYVLPQRSALDEAALRNALRDLGPVAPARLAARKNKRVVLLPRRSVLWAGVEDRMVFLHSATERLVTDKTIGELEEMLKGGGFLRVNRSDLVNLEHVREMVPWTSGTWRLTLSSGAELDVSRDRVRYLKALVGL